MRATIAAICPLSSKRWPRKRFGPNVEGDRGAFRASQDAVRKPRGGGPENEPEIAASRFHPQLIKDWGAINSTLHE